MRSKLMVAALACLAITSFASAQIGMDLKKAGEVIKLEPPSLQVKSDDSGGTMPLIMACVLVIFAVGVNLIPPKRGHQD